MEEGVGVQSKESTKCICNIVWKWEISNSCRRC